MTIEWLLNRLNLAADAFAILANGKDFYLVGFRLAGSAHNDFIQSPHVSYNGKDYRFAGLLAMVDFQAPQDQTLIVYVRGYEDFYQVAFAYEKSDQEYLKVSP